MQVRRENTLRVWDMSISHSADNRNRKTLTLSGTGWATFRDDNDINLWDEMVWRYHGNSLFTVGFTGVKPLPTTVGREIELPTTGNGRPPSWFCETDGAYDATHFIRNTVFPCFVLKITASYLDSGSAVMYMTMY